VLADMLLEVVLDHHASLPAVSSVPQAWPAAPDLLSRSDTSLKDIAVYFTRPVWCGVFLGRDDIGRLGRSLTLPIGFGDRGQIMTNLFRSAVTYERLPDLLAGMRYLIDSERFALEAIAETYASAPIADAIQPWLARLEGSIGLISRIESGAQALAQSS
jgi:putative dimethyl sulfoxide reductase chaperone